MTFSADRPCPYLARCSGAAQVRIVEGKVPESLSSALERGLRYEVNENEFLLQVDRVARFYLREGREIVIQAAEGASWHSVCLYLYGPIMAVLLRQRGLLVLRASAVADVDGRGLLLMGPSAVGKSMLAAYCLLNGYRFISDDLSVVRISNGQAYVDPGAACQRLWLAACRELALSTDDLERVEPSLNKYWVDRSDLVVTEPLALKRVVAMDFYQHREAAVTLVQGGDKVRMIHANAYHTDLACAHLAKQAHFASILEMAKTVQFSSLKRDRLKISPARLMEALSTHGVL